MASPDPRDWLENFGEAVNRNGHDTQDVIRIYLQGKEFGYAMPLLWDGAHKGFPIVLTHGKRRYCLDNGDEFEY